MRHPEKSFASLLKALPAALIVTALTASCASAKARPPKSEEQPDILTSADIYYSLPRTVLVATAVVKKTDTKKGPCAPALTDEMTCTVPVPPTGGTKVADCIGVELTGTGKNRKLSTSPSFKLGTLTLESTAEADPDHVYTLPLAGKSSFSVTLDERGVLTEGNLQRKPGALAVAARILKSALPLVSALKSEDETLKDEGKDFCKKKAEEIIQARQQRDKLIDRLASGSPIPAETAKLAFDKLDEQEKTLRALFVRQKARDDLKVICEVRPKSADSTATFSLFEIRPAEGVKSVPDQRVSCRIPNDLVIQGGLGEEPKTVQLELANPTSLSQDLEAEISSRRPDPRARSFVYRFPAWANVALQVASKNQNDVDVVDIEIAERLPIAQLGHAVALPPAKRGVIYTISLHPETGALKKLTVAGKTGDGEAIGSILDSVKAFAVADAAADDELMILKRERELLEERVKIEEAREKLGLE